MRVRTLIKLALALTIIGGALLAALPAFAASNAATCSTQYTVVRGDTMFSIAQKYKITVDALVQANNLANPSKIFVGQVLCIPAAATSTPTPTPAPTRIKFATGAVSATVTGTVTSPQRPQYVLRALKGQLMTVEITSKDNRANFAVQGVSDGQPLKRLENESRKWSDKLPATQDYLLTVAALPDSTASYTLTITIVTPTPTPTPAPTRITFPSGAFATTVQGTVTFPQRPRYLLRALKGQEMRIEIISKDNRANFSVQGVTDGQPLKRVENEDRVWSGKLPSTQDYLITIAVPGNAANFTLMVSVK
jgi:murein DD-endopeptidase MepM/ murein hydrolase activator NlpD